MTLGTHTGHGAFGPPTNRSFAYRAIADCVCRDERHPRGVAVCATTRPSRSSSGSTPSSEARARRSCAKGRARGARHAAAGRRGATPPRPTPAAATTTSGGERLEAHPRAADGRRRHGHQEGPTIAPRRSPTTRHPARASRSSSPETEWMRLRSAFPSRALLDRSPHRGAAIPASPTERLVRWSLTGSHDGHGAFGAPTGASVQRHGHHPRRVRPRTASPAGACAANGRCSTKGRRVGSRSCCTGAGGV